MRLRLRAVTQRCTEEARRNAEILLCETLFFFVRLCGITKGRGAEVLFWNADDADLAEARGFFNCVDLGL